MMGASEFRGPESSPMVAGQKRNAASVGLGQPFCVPNAGFLSRPGQ